MLIVVVHPYPPSFSTYCQSVQGSDSPRRLLACPPSNFLSISAHLYSPLSISSPELSHAVAFSDSCPTSRSASPLPSPPPVPLIVLFSAEGYSCLQGYENVKKAHSIFSYINSHFPPEQTHFPGSDLPRCTSHFPPFSLHYLSTIVRGK